ncbi:hypothetical protein K456DRAFT_480599 [Colletotrichum gloeosporioides 23]|nr:hypothetical protein K456DRAFT_480599 [Colletotrichum gloeosporioides 23]
MAEMLFALTNHALVLPHARLLPQSRRETTQELIVPLRKTVRRTKVHQCCRQCQPRRLFNMDNQMRSRKKLSTISSTFQMEPLSATYSQETMKTLALAIDFLQIIALMLQADRALQASCLQTTPVTSFLSMIRRTF